MSKHKEELRLSQYSERELIAYRQSFEFSGKIKDYLGTHGIHLENGSYLIDNGATAGVFSLIEENNVSSDGIKIDLRLGVTARTTSVGGLAREVMKTFPQFKIKDSERELV